MHTTLRRSFILLCMIVPLLYRPLTAVPQTPPDPVRKVLSKALIEAVKKGDAVEVKRLLDQGANPGTREVLLSKPSLADHSPGNVPYLGNTALVLAIRQGSVETVRLLLHKGANANEEVETSFSPLTTAINEDSIPMVRLLLAAGASPDQRNSNGDTALGFAANRGNIQAATLLLNAGADPEAGEGWTPLMEAAYNDQKGMIVLLLKKGARVNFRRKDYGSALEYAEDRGHDEIAAILRKAGGKSRPRALQGKEEKYSEKEIEQSQKKRKAERHANALRWSEERKLTAEDKQVLETVFLDMLAYKGKDLGFKTRQGDLILLVNETAEGPDREYVDSINYNIDNSQANDFSLDMREHLVRRNWEPVSLAGLAPLNKRIRLVHEDTVQRWFSSWSFLGESSIKNIQDSPPPAKCWVRTQLPAYSKQHDRAIIQFWFGPSSHGAEGTYLLIKQKGVWRVKWRHFGFHT